LYNDSKILANLNSKSTSTPIGTRSREYKRGKVRLSRWNEILKLSVNGTTKNVLSTKKILHVDISYSNMESKNILFSSQEKYEKYTKIMI
jgi:hypothetical protein